MLEDTTALKEEIIFENEELDLSYSDEEKKLRDAQDILWEDDYFQLYKTCPWQLPPSSSPPVGTNSLIHRWDPTRDLINKKEPGSFPLWDQLQVEEDVNLSSSSETSLDSRNMGKSDVAKTVFLDHSYCCPDADEIDESESWNLESPLETISSSCFEISSPLFDPDLLLETIESNYEDDFFKLSEDPKAHDCPSNVQVDEISRSSTKALIHGQDEFLEDSEGTEQNCQPDVRVVDPDVVPDLACNETLDVTLESFISSPSMSCCPLL